MKEVDMRLQVLRTKRLRKAYILVEKDGEMESFMCPGAQNLHEHIDLVNAAQLPVPMASGYTV
jgi:hypothetical protein